MFATHTESIKTIIRWLLVDFSIPWILNEIIIPKAYTKSQTLKNSICPSMLILSILYDDDVKE